MKRFKKMMALVIATMMIAMYAVVPAWAADKYTAASGYVEGTTYYSDQNGTQANITDQASYEAYEGTLYVKEETVAITVTRDVSTYQGEDDANSRNFTWYRVFTASYGSDFTGNEAGDGGYDSATGDPLQPSGVTTNNPVSYTASPTVAAKLGTIAADGSWTTNSGNKWFDLTYIPGTGNYSVKWRDGADSSATGVQAAAQWLSAEGAYDETGTLEFTGSGNTASWTADELTKGYYLLVSEAGKNLIAATTDVKVKEKNDYPPLDKTQADEDDTAQSDDARDVAVGDTLTYQVKVTIPKTAKVGDKIVVWDKPNGGLTYNNDVSVKSNEGSATVEPTGTANYTGTGTKADAAWNKCITVTADSLGKDVIFEFTMTVNSDAIVTVDKSNESGLKYGRGEGQNPFPYESEPDKVEYKTYFAGIEKVDGDAISTKLANVEFTLKEGDTEFKVTKVSGKDYYIPDANGSATVVTADDGTIKIRGIDNDKTYTLTETNNPNEGYNMLAEPVTLTLSEDTATTIEYTPATEFISGTTYYTKSGTDYIEATGVTAEIFNAVAAGTYYTKTTSTVTAYDGTTADTWTDVKNFKGTILPSTGGVGTTLFYLIGALLIIGAGVLLVTRRRVNTEE